MAGRITFPTTESDGVMMCIAEKITVRGAQKLFDP